MRQVGIGKTKINIYMQMRFPCTVRFPYAWAAGAPTKCIHYNRNNYESAGFFLSMPYVEIVTEDALSFELVES